MWNFIVNRKSVFFNVWLSSEINMSNILEAFCDLIRKFQNHIMKKLVIYTPRTYVNPNFNFWI